MKSLLEILKLTVDKQKELFANINYMNMDELKRFCNKHRIPYMIHALDKDGIIISTRDGDRKGIVIKRIEHYLNTGEVQAPTTFGKSVVNYAPLPSPLKAEDKVYYGQYKNNVPKISHLLESLTKNKFKFGAIAQEVIRECWTKGEAPTYKRFAELWLQANEAHQTPNPEWAFLADRRKGTADGDWKQVRIEKANSAIEILNKVSVNPPKPKKNEQPTLDKMFFSKKTEDKNGKEEITKADVDSPNDTTNVKKRPLEISEQVSSKKFRK